MSMANEAESISNGVRSCGACCGHSMVGSQEAILHAHHSSRHVGEEAGDYKGAQPAGLAVM